MTFALLMPAAGGGARLGSDIPKALIEVDGEPLFVRALRPFLECEDCVEAVIAAPRESLAEFENLLPRLVTRCPVRVVPGGATRQASVGLALKALAHASDVVLVHDAARPLIERALIEQVLIALANAAAAVPGLPVSDTIKRVQGQPPMVESTVERSRLYAVQTPQGLRRQIVEEAYRRLQTEPFEGTDDVSLVEHFKLGDVRLVEGDPRNIKVTTVDDLRRVQELLALPH